MRRSDLTFGAKCLLGRLKRYGQKSSEIFPSLPSLARELGTSLSSLKRFMAELKDNGLVRVAKAGLGRRNTNYYELCSPPKKGSDPAPFKKPKKGFRSGPFFGSGKGFRPSQKKGSDPAYKETIVGRKKQGKRQEPSEVKGNGFSSGSDRRKNTGTYQATLADGEAFVKLMFDATGKTEKVETALRWLRLARRVEGWWQIDRTLREKLASNPPRNNAWFKTVLQNEFGLSPSDAASQKSDLVERYRKAIMLPDPAERSLEAQRCMEEAANHGISLMI